MVMISKAGEARTPSYHSMRSPRYGGCVSAFLHFFDWNPSKRFSSTKRLPANKPEKAVRSSRSVRSEHGSVAEAQKLQICDNRDAAAEESVPVADHAPGIRSEDASARAPGVVARLMGLESLPDGPYYPPQPHRRCQSYTGGGEFTFAYTNVDRDVDSDGTTPVLLEELLRRDFKSAKRTLRDRMPGFAKRAQEQYEHRFTKKGPGALELTAYIDIPDVQRRINQRAKDGKLPFLSRLAPSTSQRTSPLLPSKLHTPRESPLALNLEGSGKHIPELTLQQPGWPLAAQHRQQRTRDLDHEASDLLESERSTECGVERKATVKKLASSSAQRLLRKSVSSNVDYREGSVREFRASVSSRSPVVSPKLAAQRIRNSCELADQRRPLIPSRIRSIDRSQSPVPENSRTSCGSHASTVSTASRSSNLTAISSKSSGKGSKTGSKAARTVPEFARTTLSDVDSTAVAVKVTSKPAAHCKPPPLDGYRAPKARNPKVEQRDISAVVSGSRVFPSANSPSRATVAQIGSKVEADKPVVRKMKFGELLGGAAETKSMRPSPKQSTTTNTLEGIQRVRKKMLATTTPMGDRVKRENLDDMATQNSCGVIPKHARARSVDEVFPEIPLDFDHSNAFTSSICETGPPISDSASLSRSIERMFGQGFADVGHFPGGLSEGGVARGVFPGCEERNAPADDLRWVDEIVERRVSSPLCGRSCERSCSGPSISSVSVDASDVDDERNGDAWSSCASYNPADCDSPRTFELPDTDADSDLPEQISAPTFVKRISEESDATSIEVDEAGQPSPVSILNSPFHDEACTTSESSLTVKARRPVNGMSTLIPHIINGLKPPPPNASGVSIADSHRQHNPDEDVFTQHNDSAKIRQALLDISMFQSLEVFTFEYKERTPSGPKEEQGFVGEILAAAHLLSTPGSSPNWFNRDLAIDPSLFDRLESGDMDHAENGPAGGVEKLFQISGGLWRCDRKLLFDCVNEAFALVLWRYGASPEMGPRPRGQQLVEEVYKKIVEWRKLASHSIDFLIERDMSVHFSSRKNFSAEVAEVGLDIESMLWKAIVEEAVVDIPSTWKHRPC